MINYYIFLSQKIIRILSKNLVPIIYLVNFLPYIYQKLIATNFIWTTLKMPPQIPYFQSCISGKYCHISQNCNPCDWFCGPGSHMINGAFPLHGTTRSGSVRHTFGGFPLGTLPSTFLVPPRLRFQASRNAMKSTYHFEILYILTMSICV